ncbi:hypothetical protein KCP76_21465 [Salmonella enterica subsp. enterica serovar Weltevreden]|nr:hypothetical protein KCP76_21465 [Salmonella enterica subsp. enterica serovar Weltevreden]
MAEPFRQIRASWRARCNKSISCRMARQRIVQSSVAAARPRIVECGLGSSMDSACSTRDGGKVVKIIIYRQRGRGNQLPASFHHLEFVRHGERRQRRGEMARGALIPVAVSRLIDPFAAFLCAVNVYVARSKPHPAAPNGPATASPRRNKAPAYHPAVKCPLDTWSHNSSRKFPRQLAPQLQTKILALWGKATAHFCNC